MKILKIQIDKRLIINITNEKIFKPLLKCTGQTSRSGILQSIYRIKEVDEDHVILSATDCHICAIVKVSIDDTESAIRHNIINVGLVR